MMHARKPYPEMKDSGVPWLGDVPAHWSLQRTKTLLRERVEKGFPNEPLLAATQTKGVVRKEKYENRTVLALKDLHLLKLVRVGDFVISLRSFQGGIEHAREQGIISPAYTVLHPYDRRLHPYLAHLLKSKPYVENLSLYVTGIRQGQNIDYEKLSRSSLPVPPLSEQAAIVQYLNFMDRRIRRYIRAKQKLIKLLEEQKQAIIHQAVTRGLDPNVPLKPSGVEWLGDVPAHWEVRRLRDSVTATISGVWGSDPGSELDLACVRVADFDRDNLTLKSAPLTQRSIPLAERPRRLLQTGDLLIEKSGGGDQQPVGTVVLITAGIPAVSSNFIARMPVHSDYDPSFLLYLHSCLYAIRLNMRSIKQTTGIQNLNLRAYLSESVAYPPVMEQRIIAEYLNSATTVMQETIERARHEIELLREYRTRLIADVVTGKLDVREAAARLPDEGPETIEEDDAMGEEDGEAMDAGEAEDDE